MSRMSQHGHGEPPSSSPMNVQQIVEKAQSFDFNPFIPLKSWLRTAANLLKEAEIYEHEGNDQQTYFLLFRYAQLVLSNLSTHPDARQPQYRVILAVAKQEVDRILAKLEVLKPRLNERYERYRQLLQDRDRRVATSEKTRQHDQGVSIVQKNRHENLQGSSIFDTTETLAAEDNKDLAVKLAHKEFRRRASAKRAVRQAGISEEEEQERRTAGLWGNWEESLAKHDHGSDRDTLSEQMQSLHVQSSKKHTGRSSDRRSFPHSNEPGSTYRYPPIPEKRIFQEWSSKVSQPTKSQNLWPQPISNSTQGPKLPPKVEQNITQINLQESIPQHTIDSGQKDSALSATTSHRPDLRPSTFTFKPSAYLENGTPLRTIFLPPDLRFRFLSIALPNTRANLETCGILCGTLISNALFISKLVIPDQESTSDTCETVNEDKLFDYVDGEDLMVLGWIHTHPTQTCFMSSRDLHTHSGYQAMMPESIAIVCAPSKGEWGVFRLTDPPGMRSVLSCTQKGLFHPHIETNIYASALRPGHVFEAKGLEYDVVDLRSAG